MIKYGKFVFVLRKKADSERKPKMEPEKNAEAKAFPYSALTAVEGDSALFAQSLNSKFVLY